MASPPPCRQRKNNSHSPDPPAFGRLRTGREAPTRRRHAAFFVGGLRVVLKRAPVRFPEILLRMFPPRRQRRAPFPVPQARRCAVVLCLDGGKEFVCARVRRGPRSPGHAGVRGVFARRPITSARQGELEGRRPGAGGKVSLSSGRGDPLCRTRAFHGERTGGREQTPFPARRKQRETSIALRAPAGPPAGSARTPQSMPPSEHPAPCARSSCPLPRPDACKTRRSRSARSPEPMPVGCLAVSCCDPNRASQLEKS